MSISEKGSENLIDLLKVTNLTIIAISVALISNVVLSRNIVAQRPLRELHILSTLRSATGALTLNKLVSKFLNTTSNSIDTAISLSVSPEPSPLETAARFPFKRAWTTFVGVPPFAVPRMQLATADKEISGAKSLKELKELWDLFANVTFVWTPQIQDGNPYYAGILKKGSSDPIQVKLLLAPLREQPAHKALPHSWQAADPDGVPLYFLYYRLSDMVGIGDSDHLEPSAWLEGVIPNEYETLQIDLHTNAVSVDLIGYWLKQCKDSEVNEVRSGDFARVFPALSGLASNYDNFDLDDVRQILESEEQSKEAIEVFGAKIPTELLVQFGIPILLILQLQFGSVCGFLAKHASAINTTLASKWSFLLRGIGFFLFSYGTTVVLPIASATASVWFVTHRQWYWWPALGFVVGASAIAGIRLMALRKKVDLEMPESNQE